MELLKIKNIVSTVAEINKKYDAIAKITGDNFNIFRILKIQANEVKTHSALIAELLNPKGTHGCDDTFLKLFLDLQRKQHKKHSAFLKRFEKFETTKSSASVEKHIGFKSNDETEGGRIDILVTDHFNNAIIIENKIYAGDSNLSSGGQIQRYRCRCRRRRRARLWPIRTHRRQPPA